MILYLTIYKFLIKDKAVEVIEKQKKEKRKKETKKI